MADRREAADVAGALVVLRGGTPVIESYTGLADHRTGEACVAQTRFQLASVSKQFTAATTMLLVEQGVLALADPIGRWIDPGLGHWPEYPDVNLSGRTDAEQEIMAFRSRPLLFPPGSRWRYSSPGYVLLAHIIERASGEAYATFVTDRILQPAKLDETFVGNGHGRPRVARGYRDGKPVDSFELDVVGVGAGDISSTAIDLAHWIRALGSGRVVTEAARRTMFTGYAAVSGDRSSSIISEIHSGYGVFVGRTHDQLIIFHTGDNFGFKAMSIWLPESDVAVAILSNEESTDLELLTARFIPRLLEALA